MDMPDVERAMPIFDTLRPPGPREDGFVHAGPGGAGHFAKMVHNGIEYALMTAYAEGYELLAAEDLVKDPQAVYQAWTNGTVVRSWLQQLLAKALKEEPKLAEITGDTDDSGEGRGLSRRRLAAGGCSASPHRSPGSSRGRTTHRQGRRRAAQPVRWPRGQESQRVGIGCR
jgi:6-phosphogluconate dehydrogenase (decarboxylating)